MRGKTEGVETVAGDIGARNLWNKNYKLWTSIKPD